VPVSDRSIKNVQGLALIRFKPSLLYLPARAPIRQGSRCVIEEDEWVLIQANALNDLEIKPFPVQLIVLVFLFLLAKNVGFIQGEKDYKDVHNLYRQTILDDVGMEKFLV
jgi:hypothetical protein